MRLTQSIKTKYFFPSKLMEFLASGTPVISTCPGHVREEFGEFLFPLVDETPQGLAAAIRHAATVAPETRRDLANKARTFMLANKTWQAQAARVAAFLEDLSGNPTNGSASCK